MNNERRSMLLDACDNLSDAVDAIQDVIDEEQDAYDDLSDRLQMGATGDRMLQAIADMESFVSDIEDVIGKIEAYARPKGRRK